ncbi:ferredoxin [Kitasatospora sp. NPDC089797]|uniref:ferredoxin n=1 Tax=Kitasatospora sp. NPDC089797 TaxID=3155298 RepID=UPI003424C4EF
MKIVVDLNRCQGYAQCVFLAPRVFELHGEESLMYIPQPPGAERERVLRAAVACPVQAILVEDPEAGRAPGEEDRSGVR